MSILIALFYFIVAICIIGTVLWAFQKFVAPAIPAPFGWVGGLFMFLLVVLACVFLWDSFIGNGAYFGLAPHSRKF